MLQSPTLQYIVLRHQMQLFVSSILRMGGGGYTHYYQVQEQQWIQKKQPRTQGYSLRHESAQSAWQGIIWFGEKYRD